MSCNALDKTGVTDVPLTQSASVKCCALRNHLLVQMCVQSATKRYTQLLMPLLYIGPNVRVQYNANLLALVTKVVLVLLWHGRSRLKQVTSRTERFRQE